MVKVDKFFRTVVQYNASDLYLTVGSKPVLRINGDLVKIDEHPVLTRKLAEEYLLEILSPEQKKRFEEHSDLDFSFDAGIARFRVNIFVQRQGLGAVFRFIPEKVKSLADLDLPTALNKIIDFKGGLVLAAGPAGCGKSSTLAAILDEINQKHAYHIVTIEDPIEFLHQNQKSVIEQREVGTHTQSFHRALKAALREDSNVILIGEMRDPESFALALTAAETGHLVLGTIHTSGAAKSINRIIDAFPSEQQPQIRTQLAESLRAVVWQNLVKRKGNTGRIAVCEILFNNKAIANLIRKDQVHQINNVIETGGRTGMQTMRKHLQELAAQEIITEDTAQENIPPEEEV